MVHVFVLQVLERVAYEYDRVKEIKQVLHTLRLETSVEVPIGVRRTDVDNIGSVLSEDPFMSSQNDPDKWAPLATDNSRYRILFIQTRGKSVWY